MAMPLRHACSAPKLKSTIMQRHSWFMPAQSRPCCALCRPSPAVVLVWGRACAKPHRLEDCFARDRQDRELREPRLFHRTSSKIRNFHSETVPFEGKLTHRTTAAKLLGVQVNV